MKPASLLQAISVIILLTIGALSASGQSSATVSGGVTDSLRKPLAFTTVYLFRNNNLAVAEKTTYTNDKGKYNFPRVDSGAYVLVFMHTGYGEKKKSVTIGKNEQMALEDISLNETGKVLQGVTVTSQKLLIEQLDDKVIFNVENDPSAKTESAIDILRRTPFVSVDGDNNITVNGQSNFKVLLNGKETAMFARNIKETLKAFPGMTIVKIEVITSPSAKYDGEGIGGIINIITKKKVSGYTGVISAVNSTDKFNSRYANFNAKFGKVGLVLSYSFNGSNNVLNRSNTTTIPKTPGLFVRRNISGSKLSDTRFEFGDSEFSWELDSLNALSAYMNTSGSAFANQFDQVVTTEFSQSPSMISYYNLSSENASPTYSFGTDYIKKFAGNKEKEFSIRLNAQIGNDNISSRSWQDNPGLDRFIVNESIAGNRQYTFQTDYIHPFKNGSKIESGVKTILRRASSEFESMVKYDLMEQYKINQQNTDYFKYNQDVYSVYSSYSFKVKKTSFRVGARIEHTSINGNFVSSKNQIQQNYSTFLPNVQMTRKMSSLITMVFTYSKRLQRPFISNLNPFINNNDSLNISYGNPELNPQTFNSFSVQTRFFKNSTFVSLTLEGSYSGNKIMSFATFDPASGVTRSTSLNIGRETQFSVAGNMSTKINAAWSLFINANLRYAIIKNKNMPGEFTNSFGGNASIGNSIKLSSKLSINIHMGFWKGVSTIQQKYPVNIWYGFGGGYKLFKEKVMVTLSLANFLNKNWDYHLVNTGSNFETTTVTTSPFRAIAVGFNWRFGKLKEDVSKKKGVVNDDLISSRQGSN